MSNRITKDDPRFDAVLDMNDPDFGEKLAEAIGAKPGEESSLDYSKRRMNMADCAVEAENVADFVKRYYKTERCSGRGADVEARIIADREADVERDGYCIISRHDSVTGKLVSWWES